LSKNGVLFTAPLGLEKGPHCSDE